MSTWAAKVKTLLFTSSALTIASSLMFFPKATKEAAVLGLEMWWNVVFPSLLPFFIVSELLIGFGFVNLIGALFEPLMRPLFRVPGTGGFVWALGLASGYPAGAKLTARLRQENQLSKIEAERLVSFTNFSNPLFIFAAVAVGFFKNEELGILLAACHYLGNFCVGLVMRFYGRDEHRGAGKEKKPALTVRKAFQILHRKRMEDNRPLGQLLGDAVHSSVSTLLLIGGFIILFSVVSKVFSILHVTHALSGVLAFFFSLLHIPPEMSQAVVAGFFEITLGSRIASEIDVSLLFQVVAASFVLAFSGFSVQAQVASILADTDIRFKPFFLARCMHGVFASCFTLLLWKPLYVNRTSGSSAVEVFNPDIAHSWVTEAWRLLLHYGSFVTLAALLAYIAVTMKLMKNKSPVN
ncbi:MAG TPA: sporulation integral membrane protein YlbJ [Bacillales bacterium]|nr:sporulation integral membrane protein YlbJ [Bacillales bacterium]